MILLTKTLFSCLQVSPGIETGHEIKESDNKRLRVSPVLAGRGLVIGLPAVSLAMPPSRVRLTPARVIVHQFDRAKYMREWQARAKKRRQEDRAKAILTPRRSPRIAKKTI